MIAPELFRLRFQSLVARGLASTAIAARVGLAAASEVWGGDRPRDRPAWYLWLRDRPGAWQVELAAAGDLDAATGAGPVVGTFTIRHYPAPAAPTFPDFSAEERRLVATSFDATGTPRIALASSIPGELFIVGTLEWALDPGDGTAVFTLSSLDRLRTRGRAGALARDVPGWQLTTPLFGLVAGLHAQVEQRAAERLVVSRRPGFELVEPDHENREAADLAYGEASLVIPGRAGSDRGASLLRALQDEEAALVGDVRFDAGRPPPEVVGGDARLAVPVCQAWFGGQAHVHDRGACAC